MKTLATITFFFISLGVFAQGTSINTTGAAPDPSAMLDVSANDKGVLVPRLTTAERDAIPNPAIGLLIFNMDTKCYNTFIGQESWSEMCGNCIPQPTTAAAGADQLNIVGTSATMAANTPANGTGTWSVVSGSGGSFADTNDAATTFGGTAGTSYTLHWTIVNGCGSTQDEVEVSFQDPCPTVTDIDGNSYPAVKIGNQCWMAANLNTTRTASGANITRYCYDNNAGNCTTYGGLYTWTTAMNGASSSTANPSGVQGICPTGWHIPSNAEWDELKNFLGVATSALQTKSTTGWSSGGNGTNSSGLNVLPAGYRRTDGIYGNLGTHSQIYSATEVSSTHAWQYVFAYSYDEILQTTLSSRTKDTGYTIRCVKD